MGSDTQLPTIGSDRNITATAEGTMQAICRTRTAPLMCCAWPVSQVRRSATARLLLILDTVGNASPQLPIGLY